MKKKQIPPIIKRYRQVCRRVHKGSVTLFPPFSMQWAGMEDFARALKQFVVREVNRREHD